MAKSPSSGKTFMTPAAAARITATQVRTAGGQIPAKSLATRAISAAVRNTGNSSGSLKK
jgi:hypothetical protein